jgi:hypothetical protein
MKTPTRPYAIFFNGLLMGSFEGRTAQEAAAEWLNHKERCNPGYFDTNEVEITVGHYSNSRIQRLSVHKFHRSAWVAVPNTNGLEYIDDGQDDHR